MKSPVRRGFLFFGLCAGVLLGALSWLTADVLSLEQATIRAEALARQASASSYALWRIEAQLVSLIATEASRPPEHYTAFYQPPDAYANDAKRGRMAKSTILLPSPLQVAAPDVFKLYFEIDTEGNLSSPQVAEVDPKGDPTDRQADRARAWSAELKEQGLVLPILGCGEKLPVPEGNSFASPPQLLQVENQAEAPQRAQGIDNGNPLAQDVNELVQRQFQSRQGANRAAQNFLLNSESAPGAAALARRGVFEPYWHEAEGKAPELFLLRRAVKGERSFVQGIWINWDRLKASLLEEVALDTPGADLLPAPKPRPEDAGRLLASIPAVLTLPVAAAAGASWLSPTRTTLLSAWCAVVLALAAVGWVFRAALLLGERRGRFVSAVTHELRTPLTTFRLYSQMLSDGMVPGKADQQHYLETLRSESDRLARIVESVLLYARVEDGRGGTRREDMTAENLIDRLLPVLSQRALGGRMELEVDVDSLGDASVAVDAQAVEQILLNLVDNACKYAATAHDRRIHLVAAAGRDLVTIDITDHGPGVPARERAHIFAPFERGQIHVAGTIPGAGLGLALGKTLAKALGGDLVLLEAPAAGAAFRLRLPRLR